MKLRSHLLMLTVVTLVPTALLAIAGALFLAERERSSFERGARERVRALMTAVDTELKSSISPLEVLATSAHFDNDDLSAFREDAKRALETRRDWLNIVVSTPAGMHVVNLLVPPGTPPRMATDQEGIVTTAQLRKSVVSDITTAAVLKKLVFAVRTPVIRDGSVKYVLTAVVDPASINRLIDSQKIPRDWVIGILDTKHRFVARSHAPPETAAAYASKSLRDALSGSMEGWSRGKLLEGTDIYRAFSRSSFSGWSTSLAIPSSVVNYGAERTAWLFATGLLATMVVAFVLASLLARRITTPLVSLVAAAPAFGRGEISAIPPSANIDEVRDLGNVLHEAARGIREREERQRQAEQALRAADRAKDEFLAMLGHELRNPLATLTTAAHLLKIGGDQPDIVANAQILIGRQTQQMTHLVDDLLEVGRVTGGKIKLTRSAIDLAAVTERVIGTWRHSGRIEFHRLSTDLTPVWIHADVARIEQIASNLLDNALKYTPTGGSINVRVYREGADAVLQVADTGQGLSPDLIQRVFDLFVQGERGLAREQGGLGIGLTLVKRLAELHGGSVEAESEGIDRGAVFTVRLEAIEPPAEPSLPAPEASPGDSRQRVLIIEDNADARESLRAALRLLGHEVLSAGNGADGIGLAASEHPDIVLIDIGLPDIDGYQVAHSIRGVTNGAQMQLVALTGYGSAQDRRRAFAAGFDEHLTKPVEIGRLESLLGTFKGL